MIDRETSISMGLLFRTSASHGEASLMKWKHQHTSKLMIMLYATNHPWPSIKSVLPSLKSLKVYLPVFFSKIYFGSKPQLRSQCSGDLSRSDPKLFARSFSIAPRLMCLKYFEMLYRLKFKINFFCFGIPKSSPRSLSQLIVYIFSKHFKSQT